MPLTLRPGDWSRHVASLQDAASHLLGRSANFGDRHNPLHEVELNAVHAAIDRLPNSRRTQALHALHTLEREECCADGKLNLFRTATLASMRGSVLTAILDLHRCGGLDLNKASFFVGFNPFGNQDQPTEVQTGFAGFLITHAHDSGLAMHGPGELLSPSEIVAQLDSAGLLRTHSAPSQERPPLHVAMDRAHDAQAWVASLLRHDARIAEPDPVTKLNPLQRALDQGGENHGVTKELLAALDIDRHRQIVDRDLLPHLMQACSPEAMAWLRSTLNTEPAGGSHRPLHRMLGRCVDTAIAQGTAIGEEFLEAVLSSGHAEVNMDRLYSLLSKALAAGHRSAIEQLLQAGCRRLQSRHPGCFNTPKAERFLSALLHDAIASKKSTGLELLMSDSLRHAIGTTVPIAAHHLVDALLQGHSARLVDSMVHYAIRHGIDPSVEPGQAAGGPRVTLTQQNADEMQQLIQSILHKLLGPGPTWQSLVQHDREHLLPLVNHAWRFFGAGILGRMGVTVGLLLNCSARALRNPETLCHRLGDLMSLSQGMGTLEAPQPWKAERDPYLWWGAAVTAGTLYVMARHNHHKSKAKEQRELLVRARPGLERLNGLAQQAR